MRSFTVIGTLILIILSTACTGIGNDITSPMGTDLLNPGKGMSTFVDECRDNMREIAGQCMVFYAYNGAFPADMEALGEPYSEMICPECCQPYSLKGDTEHFALDCPLQAFINHGTIVDGVVSWLREPGQ